MKKILMDAIAAGEYMPVDDLPFETQPSRSVCEAFCARHGFAQKLRQKQHVFG